MAYAEGGADNCRASAHVWLIEYPSSTRGVDVQRLTAVSNDCADHPV
jgi:hypothetical protein